MQLEMLGTGGYHPNEHRHTACYLLPEFGLMLDAGTAAFRVKGSIQTNVLEVLLTHAHLDHVIGLTYLLGLEFNSSPVKVTVRAEEKVAEAIKESLFAKALFPLMPDNLCFGDLPSDFETEQGVRVRTAPLKHPGGSLGIRLDHGEKSIGYITDTVKLSAAELSLFDKVNVLLHEAYFDAAQQEFAALTGHATSAEAAEVAKQLQAEELWLIHQDPRASEATAQKMLAEAKAIFPATQLATDRAKITV